jgi:tetratricopeptide (TPR) repeat protein
MMTRKPRLLLLRLIVAAAVAFFPVGIQAHAQARGQSGLESPAPSVPAQASPVKAPSATPIELAPAKAAPADAVTARGSGEAALPPPDRAQAYYHLGLAGIAEEEASTGGHPELATRAIEEYKLALDADPSSPQLNNSLAELYFNLGRTGEAESAARELIKRDPDNLDAHRLLGRIYLRELSEGQNAPSSVSPPGNLLDQAIAEYLKIVSLRPQSVEDRMVLGQLYTVRHDQKKAEEQFKIARGIEPDSEEVVLNLAHLYADSGDIAQEAKVIAAVPVDRRTAKMEIALGEAYEQLKQNKDAIAALQRAAAQEPGNPRTLDALAEALLNDNQLDEALKRYQEVVAADPENADALVHIGEIQRRQGKYEDALATVRDALQKDPGNLEAGYNEGLLLDVLGRFGQAVEVFQKMVDMTSHANGAYTSEEKNNRGIFLERLGAVDQEQNKTAEAVATYQKMIDMGGETAVHGYQLQSDAYHGAMQFDKAVEVARQAVAANPKNLDLELMLAGELGDAGKTDEGLAMARGLLTAYAGKSDQRTVLMALGQMYIRARLWKDAEDVFDKAEPLTAKPEDRAYLLFLRGELADRQKRTGQAEQFFRQALELDPSNALTLNYLGYMMADKDLRLPEALQLVRKAVELDPMNGAYLDSLGWVYFKMGMYDLAEENMSQAIQRDPADPTVHDHLGDLYEKTGRIRQATAQWELSLAEFAKAAPADVEPAEVAKLHRKLDSARLKLAREDDLLGLPKPQQR